MRERIIFAAAAATMILLAPLLVVLAVIKTTFDAIVHGPKAFKEQQ